MVVKTVTIGDTHGRMHWESLNPDDYDLMIFLGDYLDSFYLSNLDIKVNLNRIIELKYKYPDKVILLLGNHDLPYYWYYVGNVTTGFRIEAWLDLYDIFRQNKEQFQCTFQLENYIWSHGGVDEKWYEKYVPKMIKKHNIEGNLSDVLNYLFKNNYSALYARTPIRGGFSDDGGPLWCHWTQLKPLKGYHQIVGHTHRANIETVIIDSNTSATIVDPFDPFNDDGKDKFYYIDI